MSRIERNGIERNGTERNGFTLVELLVVLAIIAMLLSIAAPRYFNTLDKSREAVLRENLATTRQALDKYFGDNGKYPDKLDDLIAKRYLRNLPVDPFTESANSWVIVSPDTPDKGIVFDIKSGSPGKGLDGSDYKDW
jgi:general secretion pathway protein G